MEIEKQDKRMCEIISRQLNIKLPKISIGLPVYNGAKFIRAAIESVLSQTLSDFELIISDNASTDDTMKICQEYAENDRRISYFRQKSNNGMQFNFEFVLKKAVAPYFVFLASDDSWEPGFLTENITALNSDLSAVASISKVTFCDNDGLFSHEAEGTYPLRDSVFINLWRYLSRPKENSRFYSIFRTYVIKKCLIGTTPCHGADILVMANTLLYGNHTETPNLLMHRTSFEPDRYMKQVDNDNHNLLTRFFPVLPTTWFLIKKLGIGYSVMLLIPLLRLNINKHIEYVRLRHRFDSYFSFLSYKKKDQS